jgi:hypothetical protein
MRITTKLFLVIVALTALSCGKSPTGAYTEAPILEPINPAVQVVVVQDSAHKAIPGAKVSGSRLPTDFGGYAYVELNPAGETLIKIEHPAYAPVEFLKRGAASVEIPIITLTPRS